MNIIIYYSIIGLTEWFILYILGYYDDDWNSSGSTPEVSQQQYTLKHFPQKCIIHIQGKQIIFSQYVIL